MGKKDSKISGENPSVIPFGKAVRVRNFKLWRGKYTLGRGKEKFDIDCVHVSDLDGSWMVRIPSSMGAYSLFMQGYATENTKMRDDFLDMILTNFWNFTTHDSAALHDAFFFLKEMMTFPYLLLPESKMKRRIRENMKRNGVGSVSTKEHITQMVKLRRDLYELIEQKKNELIEDYERQLLERHAKEPAADEELYHDELAEAAVDMLNEQGQAE